MRKLGGFGPIASAALLSVLAFLAFAGALPGAASAQMFSEGYQFLEAVKERDGDTATEMLNRPGSQVINTRDLTSGDTGLHIAVQRRDTLWIRFLLQRGADPNIRNKAGTTPLQIATTLGHIEGVEELITRGADVNVSDRQGETPLISAVHQRNKDLIVRLLKQGADPDRTDNSGRSAREYVELMSANAQILAEFEAADAERGDQGTKREYGPSF